MLLSQSRNYYDDVMITILNHDNNPSQRPGMQSERLTGENMDDWAAGTHVT